jgi:hypothetical protein
MRDLTGPTHPTRAAFRTNPSRPVQRQLAIGRQMALAPSPAGEPHPQAGASVRAGTLHEQRSSAAQGGGRRVRGRSTLLSNTTQPTPDPLDFRPRALLRVREPANGRARRDPGHRALLLQDSRRGPRDRRADRWANRDQVPGADGQRSYRSPPDGEILLGDGPVEAAATANLDQAGAEAAVSGPEQCGQDEAPGKRHALAGLS